jgi:protein arginine N-methyltransferase 1
MLPNRLTMHVGLIEDEEYKNDKINFWKDVYGVNMSCMIKTTLTEPLVDCVNKNMFVSTSCQIFVSSSILKF